MFNKGSLRLIEKYYDFYCEFELYALAKKSLKDRKKEDVPKSCLKDFERREKIVFDFEQKYL